MKFAFKKLFPNKFPIGDSFFFQLVLVPGITNKNSGTSFWMACKKLIFKIHDVPPFNLLKHPLENNIQVLGLCPVHDGYSIIEEINNDNESQSEGANGLSLDVEKFDFFLQLETMITQSNKKLSFNEFFEIVPTAIPRTLFIILASKMNTIESKNEYWGQHGEKKINYVITSPDGHWEQIILRAIGSLLGLGDESENAGDTFLQPDEEEGDWIDYRYPNLFYHDDSESLPQETGGLKWKSLESLPLHNMPVENKKSPQHPNAPDLSLPKYNYAPESIQLWEGGVGYRTKIYRSAHDCIMRRRIGNKDLPLRKQKLAFCKVCETQLEHMIFGESNFRSGLFIYD